MEPMWYENRAHVYPDMATDDTDRTSAVSRYDSIPTPPYSPTTPTHYPATPSARGVGLLQHAHDFVLNNPVLTEKILYDNSITLMGDRNNAMRTLSQHTIPGAEFDSSARDPPPRCHPGTRQKLLQHLDHWYRNPEQRLLWLWGSAGVGKSAIIQTFAETRSSSAILGASLFFSQQDGRAKATGAIPTLAYQLAIQLPEYRSYVSELIDLDPNIFGKSLRQQFQKFISYPFLTLKLHRDERDHLILIDGLDECEDQQAQCELVILVASFVRFVPAAPLLWVLSSRPEYHLRNVFNRPGIRGVFSQLMVPADNSEACMDVERFLRSGFKGIQEEFPDIVPSTFPWPSERQILALAQAARGLFAFATTMLKYVGDGSFYGDPVSQLDGVLSALNHHESKDNSDNPFAQLDALYTHILSSVPSRSMPVLYQILGFYILRGTSSSISLVVTANILGVPQHVVYSALQRLHSILDVPQPFHAHKKPLNFVHKSFADYLLDINRSGRFWLDMGKQSIQIALCYVQKLDITLCTDCGLPAIPLSWDCPAEEHLNAQILHEVKQSWYQVLPKILTKWTSQNHSTELEAFIDAFGKLHFNALSTEDVFGFFNLISWITSSPLHTTWDKLVIDRIPLENFNLDCIDKTRTSVYYRTKPHCWGYSSVNIMPLSIPGVQPGSLYHKYLERHSLSCEEFLKDFEALRRNYWLSGMKVLIIGSDPSQRCAVFLSPEGQGIQPIIRYYFPLKNREFG